MTVNNVHNVSGISEEEVRNLRERFWYLIDLLVVKQTLSPNDKEALLQTKS
jgi:hypothetical protein